MYGWLTAGITALLFSALLWNAERRIDKAHEQIGRLESAVQIAVDANVSVRETLEVCKEVNAFNADQRDLALFRAELAEGRIEILEDNLEDLIGETFIPTDTECRTLDDRLPDDFTDWLCIGTENCSPD